MYFSHVLLFTADCFSKRMFSFTPSPSTTTTLSFAHYIHTHKSLMVIKWGYLLCSHMIDCYGVLILRGQVDLTPLHSHMTCHNVWGRHPHCRIHGLCGRRITSWPPWDFCMYIQFLCAVTAVNTLCPHCDCATTALKKLNTHYLFTYSHYLHM